MSAPTPVPPQYYRPRPRSLFGPLVLITLGVLLLLRTAGIISSEALRQWYAHYWPLLLIVWGVAKLLEHLWARRKGEPTPRLGAGSIVFLVFFILISSGYSSTYKWNWSGMRSDWDPDMEFGFFGSRYQFTDNFAQPLSGGTQIKVLCNQGDINVTASEDGQAHVVVHKAIRAESQESANHLDASTHIQQFTQQGGIWLLDLTTGDFARGRFDLDLQLPPKMALSLSTHRGNLSASQREGNVELATDHGNASVEDIKGDAVLHLHGSARARNVAGNLQLDGTVQDGSISDIAGTLDFNVSYFTGNVELARIARQIHFKSLTTDMQLAKLDGDMSLTRGDLRGSSVSGPIKLSTRSNEVRLEDVSGNVEIDNRNAVVELHAKAPLGNIDISNVHGGIELDLPQNASFHIDAQSTNGDIDAGDFNLNVDNTRRDATAHGSVGKGGPDIRLRSDRGTIQIRKQ